MCVTSSFDCEWPDNRIEMSRLFFFLPAEFAIAIHVSRLHGAALIKYSAIGVFPGLMHFVITRDCVNKFVALHRVRGYTCSAR